MNQNHIQAFILKNRRNSSFFGWWNTFAKIAFLILLFSGCAEIATVPNISEDTVIILAPSDDLEIEENVVRFTWEPVAFADQYQLQIATPNFENAIKIPVDTIIGDLNIVTSSVSLRLENNDYEWRIRGLNSAYQTSYSSRFLSIMGPTIELPEKQVVLVSPEDGLETQNTQITLRWEALDAALLYRILITDLSDNSISLETSTDDTELEIFFTPGNYQWAIRAENEFQHTTFTERSLTITE